jgi:asparagine synthase (glutamine-hydrolysing)
MCGIAGATAKNDQAFLSDALNHLSHRGPDGQDVWHDPDHRCAIGCARLATTDVSPDGAQPITSVDGRFALVFNGYIAGHRRALDALKKTGVSVRSHSDAELVLHLLIHAIAVDGDVAGALTQLSGQYALALWDRDQAVLYLARDPLGIKPLYVMNRPDGHVAFASEPSALSAFEPLHRDETVRAHYFAHLFVPSPETGTVDVRLVPPGQVLRWQNGQIKNDEISHPVKRTTSTRVQSPTKTELRARLHGAVRQSAADAMDADCSVGTLVSGGLDSAGIAAMACSVARERGQVPPTGFVMGFNDPAMDETRAAQRLARHLGQEIHVVSAPEKPHEIFDELQKALHSIGGPFANPSVVLMRSLSRVVGRHAKVCLSGDGGDELFGGYPRYQGARLFDQYWRSVPVSVRRMLARMVGRNGSRNMARFLEGGQGDARRAFEVWNNRCAVPELKAGLGKYMRDVDGADGLEALMMAFDRDVTLPGNQLMMSDRMGMAFGVEYRLPLLAHDVVRAAAGIEAKQHLRRGGKDIWRAVVAPYLPKEHINRPKIGFNPPTADWLAKVCRHVWGDAEAICAALFDGFDVPKDARAVYWQRAISGRAPDVALTLWALMVWQIWSKDGLVQYDRVEGKEQVAPLSAGVIAPAS